MHLYHGSTIIIDKPRIIISERGRDFGNGFYTTDIKEQSIRWAKRKANLEKNKVGKAKAIISIYDFDDSNLKNLKSIDFKEPSMDWLNMVCACRSNSNYKHKYDLIIGKIANDNVGQTVSFVLEGIMRKEDALERLKFEKINNQICFSTSTALSYLKYISNEEI